jgi:putative SOS response-associated peptidase YedK
MCGRYASVPSRAELLERFVVDESNADELRGQDFNGTPTKENPVVIARVRQDAGEDAEPARELRAFRWGLLPFWADLKVGAKMINARAETVHEKPAYRRAFKSQRALIPVDPFYDWFETDQISEKTKKPLKQPFALRPSDGSTLSLAGLYEVWYDKSLADDDPNRIVPTYTIITTTATDSVGRIHDRMPMAITPDHWAEWLDPRNHDVDQLRGLMTPPADGSLDMYAVSKAVNNVKNNGPELLDPLPASNISA